MTHLPSLIAVLLGVLVCHDAVHAEGGWRRHRAIDYQALADQSNTDPAAQVAAVQDLDRLPPTAAGGRMSVTLTPPSQRVAAVAPTISAAPQDNESRFDLSVNNAPATQVFLQLGMGTNYTVVVSPELSGTVTLSLKGTTVPEALQVLRDQYGYDYRITGKRVMVYPNTIQTRVFTINYLPGRREGSSDLRVKSSSINVSNGGGTGGSSAGGGGKSAPGASSGDNDDDTSHVRMSSVSDFWGEIKASLLSMIGTGNGRGVVMNPGSGLIVVRATPAEHRSVAEFLRAVQVTIERQ
ncbi:MAG TPA: secretin N-terminal domain-containing protein, partial [Aquabacterium sp.]|nr:secretin N-terminal domain-containing protein [Aquabacterium sp.]